MKSISLPFRLDSYGRVATSTDLSKIWQDRVRTVIATAVGERVMRPTFGSSLPANLFDAVVMAPGFADGNLRAAFLEWLPGIEYEGSELVEVEGGDGSFALNVFYRIPKFEQTSPFTYSIVIG